MCDSMVITVGSGLLITPGGESFELLSPSVGCLVLDYIYIYQCFCSTIFSTEIRMVDFLVDDDRILF